MERYGIIVNSLLTLMNLDNPFKIDTTGNGKRYYTFYCIRLGNIEHMFLDADALIALSSTSDANHERAKRILQTLSASHAAALFPTTAICEAVTVLRG